MAAPRFATARTERKTLGTAAARVARLLGFELMDWQRLVLDVALEVEDGRLVYRDVVLSTMRQQGKSSLLLVLWLTRCLLWPGQVVRYTAQSGQHARKKWEEEWLPIIERSPLAGNVKIRRQNGSEGIAFPNGSRQGLVATNHTAGHGDVCDLICLDEVFAYQDARLEQGLRPTTATRDQPQFWITSTAGTPDRSPYLLEKVERGRAAVEAGLDHSLAFFEWAADPEAEPGDVATWRACMPALNRTITEDAVRAAWESMSRHEFMRSYLNAWTSSMGDALIDIERWNSLAEPAAPRPEWCVLGLDVAPQGKSGSIVAVGEDGEFLRLAVLEHGPGTDWIVPALQRIRAEYGEPHLLVDSKACASLLPELERVSDFKITALGTAEIPPACDFFLRMTRESRLRHRGERELLVAIDGAAERKLGDGWAWSRRNSGVDITSLVAATIAVSFWLGPWGSL
jgi:phage terminase large subunit-like protein